MHIKESNRILANSHTNTRVTMILTLILALVFLRSVQVGNAQPTVQTLPADGPTTDIYGTFYGINGKVDMNGQDTDYTFKLFDSSGGFIRDYPDPSGTLTSSSVDCSSGTCDVGVAIWIYRNQPGLQTDLQPATTYSFQLIARWAGGDWQYGAILSFTTEGTPSLPTVTQIWTALTFTSTASTNLQPVTPFDFNMALTPSSQSVNPGKPTDYMILLTYSDPSYAGTMINIQLTGLGPGMNYQLSQSGALTITTSPTTPTGTYTFTVLGSAQGVTHQTTGTITVTQPTQVSTTPATTITTPIVITTPTVSVTTVITQTATVQPSSTSTQASTSDVMGLVQQNSLLIIVILVIALAALLLRGRRRSTGQVTQTQPQTANVTYCSHCGTVNPAMSSYCRKCGSRLN